MSQAEHNQNLKFIEDINSKLTGDFEIHYKYESKNVEDENEEFQQVETANITVIFKNKFQPYVDIDCSTGVPILDWKILNKKIKALAEFYDYCEPLIKELQLVEL
jgi:hypothetical protein